MLVYLVSNQLGYMSSKYLSVTNIYRALMTDYPKNKKNSLKLIIKKNS